MSTPRKSLSDSLTQDRSPDALLAKFDTTEAAAEYAPLPRGVYTAVADAGEMTCSPSKTFGYKITFRVTEGEFAGRRVRKTYYLTDAAMAYSKRDLAKFGLNTQADLKAPFAGGRHVVQLDVVYRTEDDGRKWNEVKSVTVLNVQEPEADPFAPETAGGAA